MDPIAADLAVYDATLHTDIDLTELVNGRTRTNVALRLPDGQHILLSLMVIEDAEQGDYANIDISNFAADGTEVNMTTFAMTQGALTERVTGPLTVVMASKAGA